MNAVLPPSNLASQIAPSLEASDQVVPSNPVLNDLESQQNLSETIARIAKLDQVALGELYDRTSRLVYGVVQRILNNPASAEEITLDVYLQIWRQAGHYDATRAGPKTWMLMIARSRAIDALRSRKQEVLSRSHSTPHPQSLTVRPVPRKSCPSVDATKSSALPWTHSLQPSAKLLSWHFSLD